MNGDVEIKAYDLDATTVFNGYFQVFIVICFLKYAVPHQVAYNHQVAYKSRNEEDQSTRAQLSNACLHQEYPKPNVSLPTSPHTSSLL